MYSIYGLSYDDEIVYVGQTNKSLINRYGRHLMNIDDPKKKQKLYDFLRSKSADDIQNKLRIRLLEDGIDNVKDADKAEMKWIKEYDTKNNGLNSTNGGGGGGRSISDTELACIFDMYYHRQMSLTQIGNAVGKTYGAVRNIIDRHSGSPVKCVSNPMYIPWSIRYTPFIIGVPPWQIIV